MFDLTNFESQKRQQIIEMASDKVLYGQALELIIDSDKHGYAYWQTWLGMPIIQMPEDIITTQEIFWADRPDVVIETGIAWGGSIVLHASLMELAGNGKVVAVDRTLPTHVRAAIMKFPFSSRIHLIEGDSIDTNVIEEVKSKIGPSDKVAIFLDSDHTHDHVLAELSAYGELVTKGQHLTVYATRIEEMPCSIHRPRPWGLGNNPMTALKFYLAENDRFVIDEGFARKTLISFAPKGRLICVK
jgi:cephalosporin hydroxylase